MKRFRGMAGMLMMTCLILVNAAEANESSDTLTHSQLTRGVYNVALAPTEMTKAFTQEPASKAPERWISHAIEGTTMTVIRAFAGVFEIFSWGIDPFTHLDKIL